MKSCPPSITPPHAPAATATPSPPTDPPIADMPCGCLFNDGDMYFCEQHEAEEEARLAAAMPVDPIDQSPPIAYHHTPGG